MARPFGAFSGVPLVPLGSRHPSTSPERRRLTLDAGRRRPIVGKPQAQPLQIEIAFSKRIDALFERIAARAMEVAAARVELTQDSLKSDHAALAKALEAEVDFGVAEAKRLVADVANHNARQLRRSLIGTLSKDEKLGIKVPELSAGNVAKHAAWTVREVKRISKSVAERLAPLVTKAVSEGLRGEELAVELSRRLGIEKAVAKRIAIGQVIRINSAIRRERHQKLGCTEYIWHAVSDQHTRRWHWKLNKTRQRYDSPPMGGGGGPKDHGHPGTADVCRCQDRPVIEAPPKSAPTKAKAAKAKTPMWPEERRAKAAEETTQRDVAVRGAIAKQEAKATEKAIAVGTAASAQAVAAARTSLTGGGEELVQGTRVRFSQRGPQTPISDAITRALDRVGFRAMYAETPGNLQFTDKVVKMEPGGQGADRLKNARATLEENVVYDIAPGFHSGRDNLVRVSSRAEDYRAAARPLLDKVDTTKRIPKTDFKGNVRMIPDGVPSGTRAIAKTVEQDAAMVAVHELAHAVHLNNANDNKAQRADRIVREAYADAKREAVSRYGDENHKEFFAEAFTAYWYYPPGWMRRNAPKMHKMVEDVLRLRGMPLNPAA